MRANPHMLYAQIMRFVMVPIHIPQPKLWFRIGQGKQLHNVIRELEQSEYLPNSIHAVVYNSFHLVEAESSCKRDIRRHVIINPLPEIPTPGQLTHMTDWVYVRIHAQYPMCCTRTHGRLRGTSWPSHDGV